MIDDDDGYQLKIELGWDGSLVLSQPDDSQIHLTPYQTSALQSVLAQLTAGLAAQHVIKAAMHWASTHGDGGSIDLELAEERLIETVDRFKASRTDPRTGEPDQPKVMAARDKHGAG